MQINVVKLKEKVELPEYQTKQSVGMDIKAFIPEKPNVIYIYPGETVLIPTGFKMQLPIGIEAQIRPRSSVAKRGIVVANPPGTIDSDYRGEVKVMLRNTTDTRFTIENGMRIAQMVIAPYYQGSWREVNELHDTQRGEGGFGSTGK